MTDGGSEEFNPRDFMTSFRVIAAGVLLSPRAFFQEMRRTGGMMAPFLFMLACLVIHTLIVGLLHKDMALIGRNLALGLTFPRSGFSGQCLCRRHQPAVVVSHGGCAA